MRPANKIQLLVGAIGLLFGLLVYLVGRPPDQTYFLSSSTFSISFHNTLPNVFGSIGNSLPAFLHVFSFILITGSLTFCKKRGYLIICLSWLLIDSAFELGQKFNTWSSGIIPNWFTGIPLLENTESFFLQGTFDIFDLVAIIFGAGIAYFILLATSEERRIS